jgi:general secretion pathway protein F
MAAFNYVALNDQGKKVKGVLEGDSARQIRAQLREKALKPIDVVAVAGEKGKAHEDRRNDGAAAFRRTRMNAGELALMTRQLATLVQSNLPLADAIAATAAQTTKPAHKSLLLEVRSRVVEGHTLAYALGESPKVFNDLYRAMVRAGEHAGFLGQVLERLADYTESRQETQQKLLMAITYPVILMFVAMSVVIGLMVFVVPKLVDAFKSTGNELPILTRVIISISDYIAHYGIHTAVVIVAIIFGIRYSLRDPGRRRRFHGMLLRTPIASGLVRGMDTARFASTLSILMASGVPLLDALKIAGAVLSNLALREASTAVAMAVQEGSSLHKALDQSKVFPPMMVHMVASGEASGQLEKMLERSAHNQERELEMILGTTMRIFEPMIVVVMAGVVLIIVMAVMLPIFGLSNLVR